MYFAKVGQLMVETIPESKAWIGSLANIHGTSSPTELFNMARSDKYSGGNKVQIVGRVP